MIWKKDSIFKYPKRINMECSNHAGRAPGPNWSTVVQVDRSVGDGIGTMLEYNSQNQQLVLAKLHQIKTFIDVNFKVQFCFLKTLQQRNGLWMFLTMASTIHQQTMITINGNNSQLTVIYFSNKNNTHPRKSTSHPPPLNREDVNFNFKAPRLWSERPGRYQKFRGGFV